jgi:hypothetical protein
MDFLLILLGILMTPVGFFPTASNGRTTSRWLRRSVFLAIGAILIILGILFRMHRYR